MCRLFGAALLACVALPVMAAPARPFAVEDSIRFSTFSYPGIIYAQATPRILRSPDGAHYAAVTVNGDPASGKRVAKLWIFDTHDIQHALGGAEPVPPRMLASWTSASNAEPVSQWHWRSDSQALLFLGADDEGNLALVAAPLDGKTPDVISAPGQTVSHYAEANGHVAYLAQSAVPESELFKAVGTDLPDIVQGFGQNDAPLLFPKAMARRLNGTGPADTLWKVDRGRPAAVKDQQTGQPVQLKNAILALSPDGTRVLARTYVPHVPASWERYRPLQDLPALRFVGDRPGQPIVDGIYRPQTFVTIDLTSGAQKVLVDAPIEIEAQFQDVVAEWSPRGDRIAVRGLFPVIGPDDHDILPCALGVIDVALGKLDCLAQDMAHETDRLGRNDRLQVVGLDWGADDASLSVRSSTVNAPEREHKVRYRLNGHWVPTPPKSGGSVLEVGLSESLDQPPVVVARSGTGALTTIFNPNPQLGGIAHSVVRPYSWKDPEGGLWSGALVLPSDYQAGRRYPLIIQTHGLERARYLVDGPSPTGFAARALAARGMIVLQVAEIGKKGGTPDESQFGAAGYRAAIKALDVEGLIDPRKVGIIAWSHYGPWVMQAMVDRPSEYAAASFAESSYNGYDEYLQNIDYIGASREKLFRAQVGAKPFGDGLATWIQRSAGFQSDRVCTPTFWQINDPLSLVYGWGSYAALRAQNKPIDLLYIRGGDHALVKPRERLVEQGMNVDWFDYWLNGHIDPDPAKTAQYARWDALKTQPRCGDLGNVPPPDR